MKFQKSEQDVQSVGFSGTAQMGVQLANLSKIFKILSTSTYKDPHGSIIRELCSNGVDANVAAGKPNEPVYLKYFVEDDVHKISIKDNGIGMSDEFVNTRYMSLGDSTKDDDEEQIGGFGIGRASIFSYTSYYYLISRYDGVKKTYLISENENGLPDVLPMEEEETEECNGVEVVFELKEKKDFADFKIAAENQLKYFRSIHIEGFNIRNDYNIIQGNTFVYRNDRHNVTGNLELVWHNVSYPIDFRSLGIPPIHINCSLYFPQNTPFQPEAARENLRNIESNRKLILDKIAEFREEITSMWRQEQKCKNFWEWVEKGDKIISFGEGININANSVITEEYIWEPLENTQMNPSLVKRRASDLFQCLFSYRSNKNGWSNSWKRIIYNDKIFWADKEVTNHRLGALEWQGVVFKREKILVYPHNLNYFYEERYLKRDPIYTYNYIEPDFDYKSEFEYLADRIWDEIQQHCVDAHSIEIAKRKSNRRSFGNEEVRGKFSDVYENTKWDVRQMDTISCYRYVVYTEDEDIYDQWKNWHPSVTKGNKKKTNDNKFFLIIFTNSKHAKKLTSFYTPEQFMDTNFVKKAYLNFYEQTTRPKLGTKLNPWKNLHDMYHSKFKNVVHHKPKKDYSLPYSIKEYAAKKYSTDYIDALHKKRREYIDKNKAPVSDPEVLRYKTLYEYKKKRFNQLQEQCQ